MSYILDALKKAEADRDPEARASLAMVQHQQRRNRWLAYAAVIALIANAAILLWLFLPEHIEPAAIFTEMNAQQPGLQPTPSTPPPDATSSAVQQPSPRQAIPQPAVPRQPAAVSRRESTPPEPPEPQPQPQPQSMATETATGDTIIRPGPASAPSAEPIPVGSLPSGQRSRFPELSFSTHIYADDADLRAIVVNGTRLEEGDRLGNLSLSEITEDGAVFRFEGQLVLVSVLDAWN